MTPTATDAAAPPLAAGTEIAPGYGVLSHLSRGRTLDVYDAWSEQRGCRCIAKALRPERVSDARSRERLVQEGRLLLSFSHPHIVRGYELLTDPQPLLVMETLSGETVAHLIARRQRRLSTRDLAHLAIHIGSGLRYLHSAGYLHLDLKPSNVVAEAGRAKLIDLSVAREPGPIEPGVGTWCYLSPEQARGGEVGASADVWGLGALLFEAATGTPPFDDPEAGWTSAPSEESSGAYEGEYPQLSGRAAPVAGLRRLPALLAAAIDSCLEPDPLMRPRLADILATLEPLTGVPAGERVWQSPGPG